MSVANHVDYRSVRFLCVACHATASKERGVCSRCHVARVSIDQDDVAEDLREHVQSLLERRESRETSLIMLASLVPTALLCYGMSRLGWLRFDDFFARRRFAITLTFLFFGTCAALSWMLVRIRRMSATAILQRRLLDAIRNAREPPSPGPRALADGEMMDPDDLPPAELLRWLNVTIEG
jgi:hypothetical protein